MDVFIIVFALFLFVSYIFVDIYIVDKLNEIYNLLCEIIKGSVDL